MLIMIFLLTARNHESRESLGVVHEEKGQGHWLISIASQCHKIYLSNHESYEALGVVAL